MFILSPRSSSPPTLIASDTKGYLKVIADYVHPYMSLSTERSKKKCKETYEKSSKNNFVGYILRMLCVCECMCWISRIIITNSACVQDGDCDCCEVYVYIPCLCKKYHSKAEGCSIARVICCKRGTLYLHRWRCRVHGGDITRGWCDAACLRSRASRLMRDEDLSGK